MHSKMKSDDFIIIGRIGKPFGLKGYLSIQSFTDPEQNIFNYFPWQIQISKELKPLQVMDYKHQGNKLLIKIVACDTPELAHRYTGKELLISKHQLPKLQNNEYYWSDLEGLEVSNEEGILLGTIDHLFETGTNDVMVVKDKEKQRLIPFAMGIYVLKVDLTHNKMIVSWDADF